MPERDLLARVERANAQEFAEILRGLSEKQAAPLRAYWGSDVFEEMRKAALGRRTRAGGKGNVVVLHGIMGGELTEVRANSSQRSIWLSILRLVTGAFKDLGLNADGTSARDVRATGILKKYYGLQLLHLSREWNTRAFWYDWRLDIDTSATDLGRRIGEWFPDGPVHLVAHSMGGLVARAFIANHKALWNRMKPGRLAMLGTPNYGSFAIPQLLTGMNDVLRMVALADFTSSKQDLVETIKTFVGTYQMLPAETAPKPDPNTAALYQTQTYPGLNLSEDRFQKARKFHERIAGIVDPARMVYVAGFNQATYSGVRSLDKLGEPEGYHVTMRGDGTVPHSLGLLDGVTTFFVEEEHGALPNNRAVLDNMTSILETGTASLATALPASIRAAEKEAPILARMRSDRRVREDTFAAAASRLRAGGVRGTDGEDRVGQEEGALNDAVVAAFLRGPVVAKEAPAAAKAAPSVHTRLRVRVICAGIQDIGDAKGTETTDAISVGHYPGVMPVSAEGHLDRAISGGGEGLIERFAKRGVLRGELAQLFMIDDPRKPKRTIVVAGMGPYGRFGGPECTALARELYTTLALLGKKNLATVVIGSGAGNLDLGAALAAWVEGLRQGQASLPDGKRDRLTVTFVEYDERRALEINATLRKMAEDPAADFEVALEHPFQGREVASLIKRSLKKEEQRLVRLAKGDGGGASKDATTRLTVERMGRVLRFSAITETAAIPLRENAVDPELVDEANDQLVAPLSEAKQEEAGRYLLKLVIPDALEEHLFTDSPVVITCDASTARIHWEMMAQPAAAGGDRASFLGIGRSLTRQFATPFASLATPEAPSNRPLRVLIVGDPDGSLPGAASEAEAVLEKFEAFGSGAEVLHLIGPGEATRTRVMHELLVREYDIVHYAGHCMFDEADPAASGWIFAEGKRLSARELGRVRRMPALVFSNACESGITPDRAMERKSALAPSFAEAFFACGVRSFLCTGWPVGDAAAELFAGVFYGRLLDFEPVHAAVRDARKETRDSMDGLHTWGAYQHYGDPFWRLRGSRRVR